MSLFSGQGARGPPGISAAQAPGTAWPSSSWPRWGGSVSRMGWGRQLGGSSRAELPLHISSQVPESPLSLPYHPRGHRPAPGHPPLSSPPSHHNAGPGLCLQSGLQSGARGLPLTFGSVRGLGSLIFSGLGFPGASGRERQPLEPPRSISPRCGQQPPKRGRREVRQVGVGGFSMPLHSCPPSPYMEQVRF